MKSYAEAVKSSKYLSSANRVPLDDHKHRSVHHSVFDRIQWPHERVSRFRREVDRKHRLVQYSVFFEAEGFQGECRTVQCEILEERMLGALPADEEQVPVPNAAGQPPVYDFLSRSATSNALSPSNQCSW
jgi:hypothetical protein